MALVLASAWLLAGVPPNSPAAGEPPPSTTPLVRLPFPQDDGTLTPYTFELGYQLMTLVYDTLLWRDARGVPSPWLARSVETSPGGRQVTLRLAEGVRWHDGLPVTSADVAFTFRYVASRFHPRFTPQLQAVETVSTPDPSTVVVSLRHPAPGFLDQPLADLPILPRHLWEGLPADRVAPEGLPVGSGPYRLVEHRPGDRYRFDANADHFLGPPAVRTVEVPVISSASGTLSALERRQVDAVTVSLPPNLSSRMQGLGVRLAEGPSYVGSVLLLNLRTAPFDRPEVRRAVAASLDLAGIARRVGQAVPADRGYLHPASPFSSPTALQAFDPGTARSGLAAVERPIEVLAADNDPVRLEAAHQVAVALRQAGAGAEVKRLSRQELSKALGEDGGAATFQAAVGASPPLASFDPDFLRAVFGSDPQLAPLNLAGYRSADFDELADRVAVTADPAARLEAVTETLRLLAADVPVVPLFFPRGSYAYRQAVYDGWVFVPGSGILDKRSFLGEGRRAIPGGQSDAPWGAGRSPFVLLSLGLLALGTGLGAIAVARTKKDRRLRPAGRT